MKKNVKPVQAGEVIIVEHLTKVLPSCSNRLGGSWYCATHRQHFDNQMEKDSHIHTGHHRLAWMCFEHGYEEP